MQTKYETALKLQNSGNPGAARSIYLEILKADPGDINALYRLGILLQAQGDFHAAEDYLEQAHAIDAAIPLVCHALAEVYRSNGKLEQARELYLRAIALKPGFGQPFYGYAEITHFNFDKGSAFIEKAESVLSQRIENVQAASIHFAAGKALNDMEEFSRAFEHFQSGNRKAGVTYDPTGDLARVNAILTTYTKEYIDSRSAGCESDVPVFIVGLPRSGSTLIEQILTNHSLVSGVGEDVTIMKIANTLASSTSPPTQWPVCMPRYDNRCLKENGSRYVDWLRQCPRVDQASVRIVDKQLLNFYYIGLIFDMLPNAKIIHLERNPLDTCLSIYMRYFSRGVRYGFDLDNLGQYYQLYRKVMAHWQQNYPGRIMRVQYEDLINNQEQLTREIVAFTGLEWEDNCLRPHENSRAVRTASVWQVRQPVYSSSIGYWKDYESQLQPLRKYLDSAM